MCGSRERALEKGIDKRIRDYLVRTNLDVIAIVFILAWYHASVGVYASETTEGGQNSTEAEGQGNGESEEEILSDEERAVYAVLFPWFCEIIGVFVYYVISRYISAIPYTAIMFIVGTFIGLAVSRGDEDKNAITYSAATWIDIPGEVILLVFLPGLLFLDSYSIDEHLFSTSFWQIMTFALPMVLAGTTLTALVACYVFPYNWSFDLSMTFGSILAATDPVAVAVLLNELGAPPRLKVRKCAEVSK